MFNMSSNRKPEIQNDLPKIPKVKLIRYFFNNKKSDQQSLTIFFFSFLTTVKGNYYFFIKMSLRWDSNPQSLDLEATESFKHVRNTMRKENCRKLF